MKTEPATTAPAHAVVVPSLHYVTFDFQYLDPLETKAGDLIVRCTMSIRFARSGDRTWNVKARTTNSMTRIGEEFTVRDCNSPDEENARRVCVEVYQHIVDRWEKMGRT